MFLVGRDRSSIEDFLRNCYKSTRRGWESFYGNTLISTLPSPKKNLSIIFLVLFLSNSFWRLPNAIVQLQNPLL